jgi:hypothetical protein
MSQMGQAQRFDDVRSCPSPQGQSERIAPPANPTGRGVSSTKWRITLTPIRPTNYCPPSRARFKPSASDV